MKNNQVSEKVTSEESLKKMEGVNFFVVFWHHKHHCRSAPGFGTCQWQAAGSPLCFSVETEKRAEDLFKSVKFPINRAYIS